jgi:hypothetical protein
LFCVVLGFAIRRIEFADALPCYEPRASLGSNRQDLIADAAM